MFEYSRVREFSFCLYCFIIMLYFPVGIQIVPVYMVKDLIELSCTRDVNILLSRGNILVTYHLENLLKELGRNIF